METRENYATQTDIDGFIVHVKSENVYAELLGNVKKMLDTSNYGVERPLSIRRNN